MRCFGESLLSQIGTWTERMNSPWLAWCQRSGLWLAWYERTDAWLACPAANKVAKLFGVVGGGGRGWGRSHPCPVTAGEELAPEFAGYFGLAPVDVAPAVWTTTASGSATPLSSSWNPWLVIPDSGDAGRPPGWAFLLLLPLLGTGCRPSPWYKADVF